MFSEQAVIVFSILDDVNSPTLTVAQTLSFALSAKTPGKHLPGISCAGFNKMLYTTLLRMFNICHTEHMLVGDVFVHGVSGGEQKWVSIMEMMVTCAHLMCCNNSTHRLHSCTCQAAH